jgi:hypothetical protein
VLAGCGESSAPPVDLGTIQSLAVDPADHSLLIGSGRGLFRLENGKKSPTRLDDVHWSVTGLAVPRPKHYLVSGNSTKEDPQPRRLGLQESTDSGEHWKGVSLVGKARLDVIRVSGSWIYAYDLRDERLVVSRDRGRTWQNRALAARVIDLAVDPADPQRLVVADQFDTAVSTNGGRSFRTLGIGSMLLAWPVPGHVYGIDSTGQVWRSDDHGITWSESGDLGEAPAAVGHGGPAELFAALADGTILRSTAGGEGWDVWLAAPS